jgi:hypothetical protein
MERVADPRLSPDGRGALPSAPPTGPATGGQLGLVIRRPAATARPPTAVASAGRPTASRSIFSRAAAQPGLAHGPRASGGQVTTLRRCHRLPPHADRRWSARRVRRQPRPPARATGSGGKPPRSRPCGPMIACHCDRGTAGTTARAITCSPCPERVGLAAGEPRVPLMRGSTAIPRRGEATTAVVISPDGPHPLPADGAGRKPSPMTSISTAPRSRAARRSI